MHVFFILDTMYTLYSYTTYTCTSINIIDFIRNKIDLVQTGKKLYEMGCIEMFI